MYPVYYHSITEKTSKYSQLEAESSEFFKFFEEAKIHCGPRFIPPPAPYLAWWQFD